MVENVKIKCVSDVESIARYGNDISMDTSSNLFLTGFFISLQK